MKNKHYSSLEIQNVAVSSAIGHELDLSLVAQHLTDADFNPEQFPGIVFQPEETNATSVIFRSGKMTCTGASSVGAAYEAINATLDALGELQVDIGAPDTRILNIVSTADLGEQLNLEAVTIGIGLGNTEYDPELFPGLIYRLPEANPAILLFSSGKLVITGAKTIDGSEKALKQIGERLSEIGILE
ncbi:TATA-box-binding protein [Halococcus sp. IIIV-5B]|uniref:TATA-box-binding protein n=1 Tax=Halococcus sp. IIIV-5B TaxID=2321230 RepID=UPI000E7078D3|nr:TATA-box-binding protein [Halococcus sp. IIIV-5B]RJT07184.1 TATA-box-binding protein [Halococcus sp. IIIV-5B]